jgi:tetratricopeptide (TPR) repeat protein
VLEAMARLLGNEHPDTLNSMLNLASLYYTQNKYAKAESLHRQVLRILAEFGHRADEHPHFRTAINNYAGLLSSMGLSEPEILARLRSAIESKPKEST